jgi:hypothetical protein
MVRVLGIALTFQILVTQLFRKLYPGLALSDGPGLLVSGFSFQIGMLLGVGVAWWLLRSQRFVARLDAAEAALSEPPPRLAAKHAPLAGLVSFLITLAVTLPLMAGWPWLLEQLGRPPEPQEAVELFRNSASFAQSAWIALFAVVVAPITEELIFRGGVFRYARGRLPRWAALIAPALIFAAAHRSLTAAPPLFVFGLVQAIAYERTGRIAVPMIAHGLFNLHTVALILAGVQS